MPRTTPATLSACRLPAAALFLGLAALSASSACAQEVTDKQIQDTIEAFKKAIYKSQDPATGRFPGAWDGAHGGAAGGTSMATLALLVSGESMQRPEVEKALEYLQKTPTDQTYTVGVVAHVWSYLPFAPYLPYEDKLAETVKQILKAKSPGEKMFWGAYSTAAPSTRDDLSVMQYCVLGLWQGRKRGIAIDPYLWDGIAKHMLNRQNPDGGWSYYPSQESTESMTCAGMTVLYVCQQERDRGRPKADPKMTAALDRGQAWLEKNFTVDGANNPHISTNGLSGYHMYGYERIALASGLRYIKGQDWFTAIASQIVKGGTGGHPENRAFKLMFLARGKSPVWCNKLIVSGANWRNRPNDVYFANKWLSEMTKGDLNWVAVDVNSTSDRWLNAPIAYLSTDAKLVLDEAQEKNIRNYVDHGGILVINAETGEANAWAREFTKKLYPKFPLGKPLAEGMLADGFLNGEIPGVQTANNGARDLVVVISTDFGMKWQADSEPEYKTHPWRFLFNLYRVSTDRGRRLGRLMSPFELPSKAKTGEQIKVVIPLYESQKLEKSDRSQSICQPEGRPYDVMSIYVQNRTGMTVDVDKKTELKDVGASDGSLLHLMGTDRVILSPEELAAIKAFVEKGGTVLVETVGGHTGANGLFASSLIEPLQDALGKTNAPAEARKLADSSPLIVGQEFKAQGESSDVTRPLFSQASVERGMKDGKLRMQAISVKGADGKERDAVVFSDEDLTLGMNRVRTYGVNGYAAETAQHFMFNLLAEAGRSKPSPKMAADDVAK